MSHKYDPKCPCGDCRKAVIQWLRAGADEFASHGAQDEIKRAQRAVVRAERRLIATAMARLYWFEDAAMAEVTARLREDRLALRRAKRRAR